MGTARRTSVRHNYKGSEALANTVILAVRALKGSDCADIGRDPKEVIDEAAVLGAEGLDLAIVYLPPPYDTAVLEPLAEAIRDSGLTVTKA
jgi:hypothetical protein